MVRLIRASGTLCWAILGVVGVVAVVTCILATVSEVVLPLVLAAVVAVVFGPLCRRFTGRGWRPGLAAIVIVLGLVAVVGGTVLLAADAVIEESETWGPTVDDAAAEVTAGGVDEEAVASGRGAAGAVAAVMALGVVTRLIGGVEAVAGFLAGAVLGVLILYYLLKDATAVRQRFVAAFPSDARPDVEALVERSATTIRAYAAGRTVLAVTVAVVITLWSALIHLPMLATIAVVNFLGGYVPYLGAIIGGGLAVLIALGDSGTAAAVATLVVVLIANLALENLLEPRVMGTRLAVHPLVVLIATTLGGVVGGIVGLILAVPLFVVSADAIGTLRRHFLGLSTAARSLAEEIGTQRVR